MSWIFHENACSSSGCELCSKLPIISEYCKSVDGNVQQIYHEKVAVIAVGHITIPEEQFSLGFLHPVEGTDFLRYLVLETSFIPSNNLRHTRAWKLTISKCLGLQRASKAAFSSESTL